MEFPGTAYAASDNSWMTSEIFRNYFDKTFVTSLGYRRPVLLIYDGHSSHIDDLIISALENKITI
jgi:hypothetical protein